MRGSRNHLVGPCLILAPGPERREASWFKRMPARARTAVRTFCDAHPGGLRWAARFAIGITGCLEIAGLVLLLGLHYVYCDRTNLPDIGPFARFEFPAIGHVYDADGQPLIELA